MSPQIWTYLDETWNISDGWRWRCASHKNRGNRPGPGVPFNDAKTCFVFFLSPVQRGISATECLWCQSGWRVDWRPATWPFSLMDSIVAYWQTSKRSRQYTQWMYERLLWCCRQWGEGKVSLALPGLTLRKHDLSLSVRFHIAGEAKSAVYDCLVPYDDIYTSIETSLRAMLQLLLLLLHYFAVLRR